ncbi:hypothetical protein PYCC9005_002296 [Savitreella phatthalungensis]
MVEMVSMPPYKGFCLSTKSVPESRLHAKRLLQRISKLASALMLGQAWLDSLKEPLCVQLIDRNSSITLANLVGELNALKDRRIRPQVLATSLLEGLCASADAIHLAIRRVAGKAVMPSTVDELSMMLSTHIGEFSDILRVMLSLVRRISQARDERTQRYLESGMDSDEEASIFGDAPVDNDDADNEGPPIGTPVDAVSSLEHSSARKLLTMGSGSTFELYKAHAAPDPSNDAESVISSSSEEELDEARSSWSVNLDCHGFDTRSIAERRNKLTTELWLENVVEGATPEIHSAPCSPADTAVPDDIDRRASLPDTVAPGAFAMRLPRPLSRLAHSQASGQMYPRPLTPCVRRQLSGTTVNYSHRATDSIASNLRLKGDSLSSKLQFDKDRRYSLKDIAALQSLHGDRLEPLHIRAPKHTAELYQRPDSVIFFDESSNTWRFQ